MLSDIPQSLTDLAKAVTPKPVADFSELISLKLFGKSLAKLRAEAENLSKEIKQQGEIEREVNRPFIVEIETAKAYRQYSNLGVVMQKAIPFIDSPTEMIKDDNDVFWGLLEHAKEISNEEMQNLIAKIIAGEYNNPETYSMSTLQIIKSLGKKEIELFQTICSLLIDNDTLPIIAFEGRADALIFMNKMGIHFGSLQTLQSLGLFLPNEMTNKLSNPEKNLFKVSYFDKNLMFQSESENSEIEIPDYYGLSIAGKQILPHLDLKPNEEYFLWLKKNYIVRRYKLIED